MLLEGKALELSQLDILYEVVFLLPSSTLSLVHLY